MIFSASLISTLCIFGSGASADSSRARDHLQLQEQTLNSCSQIRTRELDCVPPLGETNGATVGPLDTLQNNTLVAPSSKLTSQLIFVWPASRFHTKRDHGLLDIVLVSERPGSSVCLEQLFGIVQHSSRTIGLHVFKVGLRVSRASVPETFVSALDSIHHPEYRLLYWSLDVPDALARY